MSKPIELIHRITPEQFRRLGELSGIPSEAYLQVGDDLLRYENGKIVTRIWEGKLKPVIENPRSIRVDGVVTSDVVNLHIPIGEFLTTITITSYERPEYCDDATMVQNRLERDEDFTVTSAGVVFYRGFDSICIYYFVGVEKTWEEYIKHYGVEVKDLTEVNFFPSKPRKRKSVVI